jgi:hypothetical protein
MKTKTIAVISTFCVTLLLSSLAPSQTVETWDQGLFGPETTAKIINAKGQKRIEVKSPVTVQGIEVNGLGEIALDGKPITLGAGCNGTFNSILVNSGDVTIHNKLINTQNKRITLGEKAQSLTLKGDIDTGGQTTQIGNLGTGVLTIYGDRTGGNSLYIRDGKVNAFGILSSRGEGKGNTVVRENGVLISSRQNGPTIESGSFGLVLLETGVFRLAAPNQIASFLNFAGGRLEMGGFTNDKPLVGNVRVTADSVIDFSNPAAESLAIADVSGNTEWKAGATLNIVGFSQGDTLRFGENGGALTKDQLSAIKFDGKPAKIDADGYLTPAP